MRSLTILVTGANGDLGRSMIYYLNTRPSKISGFKFKIIAADCKSDLLCAPLTHKRYLMPKADDRSYINKINKVVTENNIDLIIFLSDLEIRVASKNIQSFGNKVWLPDWKIVQAMQDKFLCNQVWKKTGVPSPWSIKLDNQNQVRDNTWLRPLDYIGGGGKLAFYARTKSDCKAWIDAHNGWGKFAMSEFLPGTIFGFDSLWSHGKLIGYNLKERLRYTSEGEDLGYTTSIVKMSTNKLAIRTATSAIIALCNRPDGVFSVDMRENVDGIPCATEINPGRFLTTSLLLFAELGYDLPMNYIEIATGNNVNNRVPKMTGKYLFYVKGQVRLANEKDMKINKA